MATNGDVLDTLRMVLRDMTEHGEVSAGDAELLWNAAQMDLTKFIVQVTAKLDELHEYRRKYEELKNTDLATHRLKLRKQHNDAIILNWRLKKK